MSKNVKMALAKRIDEARNLRGIKVAALARALNEHGITIDRTGLSRRLRGQAEFKVDELAALGELLDIGTDPQSIDGKVIEHDPHGAPGSLRLLGYSSGFYISQIPGAIPEIDVSAGAGEGAVGEVVGIELGDGTISGHAVIGEWVAPAPFLRHELNISTNQSVVLSVVGDSMMPTYLPGDRVIVDLRQRELIQDGVYIISDGSSPPQIKRLTRVMFSDPVMVEVVSDNSAHKSQTVPLDRLIIIGRVAGRLTRQ